jgi:hypothetical protein
MSDRDAFDGEIERLFARPQPFGDGDVFAERVTKRLNRGWRMRAGVLTAAGGVGGFFAVREALDAGLQTGFAQLSAQSTRASRQASSLDWTGVLDWVSGGGGDLAMAPTMPLFWLVSAAVIVAAVFMALKAGEAN